MLGAVASTSHAHAHSHMTTHIRIRMDIGSSSERTEHSRGGHSCSLRPRRRETSADAPPFLKARSPRGSKLAKTHRSKPLPGFGGGGPIHTGSAREENAAESGAESGILPCPDRVLFKKNKKNPCPNVLSIRKEIFVYGARENWERRMNDPLGVHVGGEGASLAVLISMSFAECAHPSRDAAAVQPRPVDAVACMATALAPVCKRQPWRQCAAVRFGWR